jgi:hypothetical protein
LRFLLSQFRLFSPPAPPEVLRCTQKLLDRVLFCAFCEDRGLFRAIDEGNAGLNI